MHLPGSKLGFFASILQLHVCAPSKLLSVTPGTECDLETPVRTLYL